MNGANLVWWTGDGWEGAAIGAAVGGTLGLGVSAAEALDKHEADISGCLCGKGYVVKLWRCGEASTKALVDVIGKHWVT